MRYLRGRSSAAVDFIEPYVLEDPDFPKDEFVARVKDALSNAPETTFVSLAFDDEGEYENEQDRLMAFVIATAQPERDFVFISQAWAREGLEGTEVQDRLMFKLCLWTENIEKTELRAETVRNPKALLRRWGFETISTVVGLKVADVETRAIKHSIFVKDTEHERLSDEERPDADNDRCEDRQDEQPDVGPAELGGGV